MSSVLKERDPTLCLGHPHTLSCQVTRPQRAHPQTDRHTHKCHTALHTQPPLSHTATLSPCHLAIAGQTTQLHGLTGSQATTYTITARRTHAGVSADGPVHTRSYTHTHRPNRTGAKPVQSHADLQNPACPGACKPRRVQVHTGTQAPLWVSPGRWPALWRSALNPQRHSVTGAHSGWGLGR